jgi:hypothetical protein
MLFWPQLAESLGQHRERFGLIVFAGETHDRYGWWLFTEVSVPRRGVQLSSEGRSPGDVGSNERIVGPTAQPFFSQRRRLGRWPESVNAKPELSLFAMGVTRAAPFAGRTDAPAGHTSERQVMSYFIRRSQRIRYLPEDDVFAVEGGFAEAAGLAVDDAPGTPLRVAAAFGMRRQMGQNGANVDVAAGGATAAEHALGRKRTSRRFKRLCRPGAVPLPTRSVPASTLPT